MNLESLRLVERVRPHAVAPATIWEGGGELGHLDRAANSVAVQASPATPAGFEQLTAFLLQVHDSAQTLAPHAYRGWLFTNLLSQIRFDSALIGLSRHDELGTQITSAHLYRLAPTAIADYREIRDIDVVGAAAVEFPGQAIVHRLGSAQYRNPHWQRLRAFYQKHGIWNVLNTGIANANTGLQTFMRLHRSHDLDYFSSRDREWHQLAMPHIAAALQANRIAELRERVITEGGDNACMAYVGGDGTILCARPGFNERLQVDWPGFDGVRLPLPMRNAVLAAPTDPIRLAGTTWNCNIRPAQCGWIVSVRARDRLDRLSNREHEIARIFAAGRTSTDIAAALRIAPSTVRRHLQNVYERLDIHSKGELIRLIGSASPRLPVDRPISSRPALAPIGHRTDGTRAADQIHLLG